jgi:hypothetical protein
MSTSKLNENSINRMSTSKFNENLINRMSTSKLNENLINRTCRRLHNGSFFDCRNAMRRIFERMTLVDFRVARFFDTVYQNGGIYPKLPLNYQNIPNGRKMFQMTKKPSNLPHSKDLQKLPKLVFFGLETIRLATLVDF